MRKYLFPLAIVAALGTAGAALANESTGTIKMIDEASHTVTLTDGSAYVFPNKKEMTAALESFKAGDHVKITWVEGQGSETGMPRDASAISGVAG